MRKLWFALFAGNFLTVSIVLHLLLGVGATVFVVQEIQSRKMTFKAGAGTMSKASRAVEHKVQQAKQKSSGGAPSMAKRIATTGLSKVALPDMPDMPTLGDVTPLTMSGMGGAGLGFGMGTGNGAGNGAGGSGDGGGTAPFFGFKAAPGKGALVGTFYDLKQTRNRKPSSGDYTTVVNDFIKGGWNSGALSEFYKARQKMYATQFFIPQMQASEAPKAFEVEKEVQPAGWIIHYQGKVSPPKDGKYRFVSVADDVIIVRIGNKVVSDGSRQATPPMSDWVPKEFLGQYGIQPGSGSDYYAFGDWIDLKASESYNMEVLLGEKPGGFFLVFLMVEREGDSYRKRSDGCPILPLFRLSTAKPPKVDNPALVPEYKEGGPVWLMDAKPTSMFGN